MTQRTLGQKSQPPRAVEAIKSKLIQRLTFLKTDANLVLACGKRPSSDYPGGRDRILDYAKSHLGKFQFFIAEHVFDLLSDKDIDLLSIEGRLSNFCDCVLIVLESESTFAELGAFAMKEELVENLLVVNDSDYEASSSFISLGPLAKVNKVSRFKPVIHTDLKSILRAGTQLGERLSRIERKKKKERIDLSSGEKFQEVLPKIRMLFLLDLITFFQPITHKEIIDILVSYYGKQDFAVRLELHLLDALGLAQRSVDGLYFRPIDNQRLFFTYYGLNEVSVRSDVLNHYHKYSRRKVEILKSKVGGLI